MLYKVQDYGNVPAGNLVIVLLLLRGGVQRVRERNIPRGYIMEFLQKGNVVLTLIRERGAQTRALR